MSEDIFAMGSDSDSESDDYALFGTALEPVDEEDVPRKRPVHIEEQVPTNSRETVILVTHSRTVHVSSSLLNLKMNLVDTRAIDKLQL